MSYVALMAHLELGRSNTAVLKVAADLARRLEVSTVIGVAACKPIRLVGGDYADCLVSGDLLEADRTEIEAESSRAEGEFRSAFASALGRLEWRSSVMNASLADYVAREARAVDLIVTGVASRGAFETSRRVNAIDLLMRAGRPVLTVPPGVETLALERVLVGWKDTREARRAIVDALPLLKRAGRIFLVEIAREDVLEAARGRLADVAGWLDAHGVIAEPIAAAAAGLDAECLNKIAQDQRADLIVAGAFGHSRLREWVLGGVTEDLLLDETISTLLSH